MQAGTAGSASAADTEAVSAAADTAVQEPADSHAPGTAGPVPAAAGTEAVLAADTAVQELVAAAQGPAADIHGPDIADPAADTEVESVPAGTAGQEPAAEAELPAETETPAALPEQRPASWPAAAAGLRSPEARHPE